MTEMEPQTIFLPGLRPYFLTPLGTGNAQIAPFPEAIPVERPLAVDLIKSLSAQAVALHPSAPFLILHAWIKIHSCWLRNAPRGCI